MTTMTKKEAAAILRDAKKTAIKIGTSTLEVFIGDGLDAKIEATIKKALARGEFVERGDGFREWMHTEELFPEVWHDDGNRTRHEVAHYRKNLETGEVTRTVTKTLWKKG